MFLGYALQGVVRALVLCFSVAMTWAGIPQLSSPMDFFLLMSQNPGLLARWQTVSFPFVTSLREESIKEIIDSVPKWERREDPENHRDPEKTATKYKRKAGYSEKNPGQSSSVLPRVEAANGEAQNPPEKTMAVLPRDKSKALTNLTPSHRRRWGGEFSDEWVTSPENAVCQTM